MRYGYTLQVPDLKNGGKKQEQKLFETREEAESALASREREIWYTYQPPKYKEVEALGADGLHLWDCPRDCRTGVIKPLFSCGVYRITSRFNRSASYVGSTKVFEYRWNDWIKHRFPPCRYRYEVLLYCDPQHLDFFEKTALKVLQPTLNAPKSPGRPSDESGEAPTIRTVKAFASYLCSEVFTPQELMSILKALELRFKPTPDRLRDAVNSLHLGH